MGPPLRSRRSLQSLILMESSELKAVFQVLMKKNPTYYSLNAGHQEGFKELQKSSRITIVVVIGNVSRLKTLSSKDICDKDDVGDSH